MGSAYLAPGRRALAAAFVALCSVLATGCLHGDVDVTVESDGSGRIVVEVFPSKKMQAELERLPFEVETLVEGSFDQVDGVEFDEITDGDRGGYRLVVPFDDYRDVQQVLVDGGSIAGQRVQLFSSLVITELPDDAGWQLEAQILPLGQAIAGANSGLVPESIQDVIDMAGIGNAGSGLDLSISLPGTIVASNATSIDGGTATWRLDDPEAPTDLQMRTEPEEFPTTVQMVLGGAGLAVALGLLLFVLGATRKHKSTKQPRVRRTRRSKKTASGVPDAGWAAPPVGTVPSAESSRPEPLPTLSAPAVPPMPSMTSTPPMSSEPPTSPTASEPPTSGWAPPSTPPVAAPPPAPAAPAAPPVPAAPQAPASAPAPATPPAAPPASAAPPAPPAAPAPAPAAPPVQAAAPSAPPAPSTSPGWYPDPDDSSVQRWWSGTEWTEHRG